MMYSYIVSGVPNLRPARYFLGGVVKSILDFTYTFKTFRNVKLFLETSISNNMFLTKKLALIQ